MACGGCGGGGNRHTANSGDLRKFAFLSSRQLRHLKAREEADKTIEESAKEEQE